MIGTRIVGQAERRAGVGGDLEAQGPEQIDRIVREPFDRPPLGELVDREGARGDDREQHAMR